MIERFERIRDMIAKATSDTGLAVSRELRSTLQDADERERDALVKPLNALLTHWRGMERKEGFGWWLQRQFTEIALVACEPDSPAMRRRLTLHCDDDELFGMIEDRRPEWMAEVMRDLFATKLPGDLLCDNNWSAAERLRRLLGAPRPLDERNVVALGVDISRRVPLETERETRDRTYLRLADSPAAVLRDDPDAEAIALAILRSPQLARISASTYWVSKEEIVKNGWPRAIAQLADEGIIDRGQAIDTCVEILTADDASAPTRTQRLLTLQLLAPTPVEVAARRSAIEGLTASPHKTVAQYATELLKTA